MKRHWNLRISLHPPPELPLLVGNSALSPLGIPRSARYSCGWIPSCSVLLDSALSVLRYFSASRVVCPPASPAPQQQRTAERHHRRRASSIERSRSAAPPTAFRSTCLKTRSEEHTSELQSLRH